MSVKRQATTELNHENWDKDDPEDSEVIGTFETAPKEELEKRVFKTAKRRSKTTTGEGNKSVFSGFGGFNKAKPSSFDFLANLTNGSANTTSTPTKNENTVTSSIFASKPNTSSFQIATSSSAPLASTSSAPFATSTFGSPPQKGIFGSFSAQTTSGSPFGAAKAESTAPEKSEPSSSTDKTSGFNFKPTVPSVSSTPQVSSSSIFGTMATANKSLFSNNPTVSTPFKAQPVASTTSVTSITSNNSQTESKIEETKSDHNPKKMKYYSKLKGLNESVTEWIRKHVSETPLCILTPIFRDYENHLKNIQEEFENNDTTEKPKIPEKSAETTVLKPVSELFSVNNSTSLLLGSKPSATPEQKPLETSTANTTSLPQTSGFKFGISNTAKTTETTTPFSFAPNTTTNGAKPFSFGTGQPFSFSPNTQTQPPKTENSNENENEDNDEPPKVEFTPVVEENSVYDKKCKVFVKKDDNFADKGVGTLYLKKLDSGKYQLLVRANTNLGNVLLNLIISSSIPTQRMGKNNVMIICIPTPEAKPPPVPVLIRVKTSEEADELLETLNKYKS